MFIMMRRLICFLLVLVMSLSVVCPVLAATNSTGSTAPGSNPKTGDQIMLYVIVMVVAMVALAAVMLCSRKFLRK